jgi:hypothetical protein
MPHMLLILRMCCRMRWSVFNISAFCLLQMLIRHCVSLLRSRLLPPMVNLKAIGRIYLPQSGVLLSQVGCKIQCTLMWPIKGSWIITTNHWWVSVTPIYLLPSLLINDVRAIEPRTCIPQYRTHPRYPGTSTTQQSGGY